MEGLQTQVLGPAGLGLHGEICISNKYQVNHILKATGPMGLLGKLRKGSWAPLLLKPESGSFGSG